MVYYKYSAYGNHAVVDVDGNDVTSGIGVLNPFRFRGYYYDTETELYYLQTRYYDPELGMFISQDSLEYADPETINGLNLYAYCGNNPVLNVDPTGTWSWKGFFTALAAAVAVVAVAVVVAVTAGAAAAAIAGAVGVGASMATTIGTTVAVTAAVGGAVVGLGELANQTIEKGAENINIGSIIVSTI